MKKFIAFIGSVLLAVIMAFSVTACNKSGANGGDGTKPGATVSLNKTELTMNEGDTERIVAATDPADEAVTFTSSNPEVATITLTGLVSALSGGTTTITATVTSSGNTATCTVTVNSQSVSIPTGSDIIRIDENQDFQRVISSSVSDFKISRSGDVTSLTYTPEIVLKNDWSNQVSLNLNGKDLTRSTKLCFNFKGNGEDVFVLVYDATTTTILQQTFKTTAGWNTYEVDIPKATRHLMAQAEKVCLTVPVPSTKYKGNGGTAYVGGLWFAGDAEPSVLKTYDYSKYEVIGSLDLSKWNSATFKDTFQGNNKVENGNTYVEGTYNEEDGSLTIVNKGYGKWVSFPMSVPSGDYSQAECIAIKAKGTAGAMIAGQVQWKEAYEMKGFTSEVKYHFADISEYPISEKGGYVSFAPCKFNTGYNEWELTIYSIEILKPLPEGAKPAPQPEENSEIPEGVTRLDETQNFVKNSEYKGSMTIKKTETVTEIWVQSAGIRDGKGKNSVTLSLKDYAVLGASELCFRIKGKGDKVVVNLTAADGTEILSEKVRTFVTWSLYKLVIPEDKKTLLDDTAILSFTVPEYDPNYKVQGGCYVYFDGVWFNGGVAAPVTHTVTFDALGGTAVTAATVTEGNKVTEPTPPTKTGYTFGGWYKEEDCNNAWNFDTDTVTANTTLYAKWTAETYNITLNLQGGTYNGATTLTFTYGAAVAGLPASADLTAPAGNVFRGWYTAVTEGVQVENGSVWMPSDVETTNVTLYAQWGDHFTVSFDLGYTGATGTPQSQTITPNGTATKPETDPTRTGYTFDGWFAGSATTAFDFGTVITKDITLTAHWTPIPYTVTFALNYTDAPTATTATVNYGANATAPVKPTREGYTFVGWFKEEGCNNAWNFETDTVTGDTTLYAKWKEGVETPDPDVPAGVRLDTGKDSFIVDKAIKTYITTTNAESGAVAVTVKGQALKKTDESNVVSLSLANVDVSAATKITLNVKGYWTDNADAVQAGVVKIKVKLLKADGTEIFASMDIELKQDGEVIEITIPNEAKATLSEAATIAIVVPVHESDPAQGIRAYFEFSGVWIDGVAKSVEPTEPVQP